MLRYRNRRRGTKIEHGMSADKFKAVTHYIIERCKNSELGNVKLNKILWYVDTIAYRETGVSVTGSRYLKRKYGPVPERILATLGQLRDEEQIHIRKHPVGSYKRTEYIPLTSPTAEQFSSNEMELIDLIADTICTGHTANSISEQSHDIVWESALDGENIPIEATLVAMDGSYDDQVITWANEKLSEITGSDLSS